MKKQMVKNHKVLFLLGSIALCQIAGIIGSFFTTPAIPTWYAGLLKPYISPPSWIFAPVWLILYTLMGISLYLVITSTNKNHEHLRKKTLMLFAIHLVLNAYWSVFFFGWRNPFLGLFDIILMWETAIVLTWWFYQLRPKAALLLLPYLAWISFAAYLNYQIFILN